MEKVLIAEMTWPELQEVVRRKKIAIIPAGTNENNGPHLPLSLDTVVAHEIALRLGRETGIPVAPTIPFGNSSLFGAYPGTIVIRSEIMIEIIKDICRSLGRHGFERFLILTPHLPNIWGFNIAGETLRKEGYLVATVDWWRLQNKLCADLTEGKSYPTGHASELATSLLWALRPELVHPERMTAEAPANPFWKKHGGDYPMLFLYNNMHQLSVSGICGDPSKASKEKGEEIIRRCLPYLVELCGDMEKAELPPKE
jgi:creatinine amidohydrolase